MGSTRLAWTSNAKHASKVDATKVRDELETELKAIDAMKPDEAKFFDGDQKISQNRLQALSLLFGDADKLRDYIAAFEPKVETWKP
eukprot:6057480-Pyramimonas_sp.AAC.2